MDIKKSPYEWCLQYNVRPYEPENWGGTSDKVSFGHFHETEIAEEEFLNRLKDVKHKENSRPRKMDEFLELKMYGLVIYQLTGMQKGIQFKHAGDEYENNLPDETDPRKIIYRNWVNKWKTVIVLDGGTTNSGDCEDFGIGSLQKYLVELRENGIHVDTFCEPDLNNAMTAICFIADERVFLKDDYPPFEPTPKPYAPNYTPNAETLKAWEDDNKRNYNKWVEKIGGAKNAFLREFLKGKRLASN